MIAFVSCTLEHDCMSSQMFLTDLLIPSVAQNVA